MKVKRVVIASIAGTVLIVTLAVLAYYGTRKKVNICSVCGETQTIRQFQVPGTTFTLLTTTSSGESLVGEVISQSHLVDDHPHEWKTVYVIGNGQPLTMGDGQTASNVFNSSEVSSYLQVIAGFQSHKAIAKYLEGAQNDVRIRQEGFAKTASFVNESLIEPTTRKADPVDVMVGPKP
jgi:hypothetical protein